MSHTYDYPRPSVTADCIVFNFHDHNLRVMLIQRKDPPYKELWAFPGGFIEMEEELEDAASRELEEETGLKWSGYEQLGAFGKVGRDPRGRVISIAFVGFILDHRDAIAGSDAANVRWFDVHNLPKLAFDHDVMLKKALDHLTNAFAARTDNNKPPFGLTPDIANQIRIKLIEA